MKKKVLITICIVVIILILGFITRRKDNARVRTNIEPKYTIRIINKNENKITYWGIGYKVIRYYATSPKEDFKLNLGVKIGNWFMKY